MYFAETDSLQNVQTIMSCQYLFENSGTYFLKKTPNNSTKLIPDVDI